MDDSGTYAFVRDRNASLVAFNEKRMSPAGLRRTFRKPPLSQPLEPLPKVIPAKPKPPVVLPMINKVRRIMVVVCEVYQIKPDELLSPWRSQRVAWPRFAAYRLIHQRLNYSSPNIAGHFNRDHSTILSGLKRAAYLYTYDDAWRHKYERAIEILEAAQ